jgi:hypothetical protein
MKQERKPEDENVSIVDFRPEAGAENAIADAFYAAALASWFRATAFDKASY